MKNSNVPISTQEYGTAESKLTLIKIYPKLFYVFVIIVFVISKQIIVLSIRSRSLLNIRVQLIEETKNINN